MSTFERVKQWNINGGKTPPDDHLDLSNALINQLSLIKEEANEIKDAQNMIDILDGVCDVDVTVAGFLYLFNRGECDITLDCYTEEHIDGMFKNIQHTYDNVGNIVDELLFYVEVLQDAIYSGYHDVYDLMVKKIIHLRNTLIVYASNYFDYNGAINAVLDNNDTKFYTGDEYVLAFKRAADLSLNGDEHTVITTLDEDKKDGVDLENIDFDDLIARGAIFSVHRVHDDKICKPENFVGVDLTPFI